MIAFNGARGEGWMKGAIMLKEIEAEAAIENCRALINQIDAGLSAEGPFGDVSSRVDLLLNLELHLEHATSALERSLSHGGAHYNEVHPHKALGYRSPREFVAAHARP